MPESADCGRNWDYRYCWLRDSYFVIQALNRLGATRTMEGYLRFIDRIVAALRRRRHPAALLGVGRPERARTDGRPSLRGYRGMGPVRVGNQAYVQLQHDVYGAIVLASAQSFFDERLTNLGDDVQFEQLERIGERALEVHDRPDAGPWEFRGFERVHTYSAAMCWAGVDRLARSRDASASKPARRTGATAPTDMREHILERAWNEDAGAFTSSYGGADLDATALLLPELGLVAATDPRFTATLARDRARPATATG